MYKPLHRQFLIFQVTNCPHLFLSLKEQQFHIFHSINTVLFVANASATSSHTISFRVLHVMYETWCTISNEIHKILDTVIKYLFRSDKNLQLGCPFI